MILLHGFPDTGNLWRHQVAALSTAGYRVITPDLRGYGLSDKPTDVDAYNVLSLAGDVVAVLDDAGVERCLLYTSFQDDAVLVVQDDANAGEIQEIDGRQQRLKTPRRELRFALGRRTLRRVASKKASHVELSLTRTFGSRRRVSR